MEAHAVTPRTTRMGSQPDRAAITRAVAAMKAGKRPLFYTGGGVINSGPQASAALRRLVELTGFPVTSTLMGLGAFPGTDQRFLGMLGMHGTYEPIWQPTAVMC